MKTAPSETAKLIVLSAFVAIADCTCNSDQYNSCLKAAVEGSLTSLAGGGVCQPKPYIQFTHICSVKNYMPIVDYCCCMFDQTTDASMGDSSSSMGALTSASESGSDVSTIVMCCRYHQDWNHFRCAEPEDVVQSTPQTSGVSEGLISGGLMATLATIASVIVCIVCCIWWIKCCCYRYEGDSQLWCCHYCPQDVPEASVSSQKPVKPVVISSPGEIMPEDNIGCYDPDGLTGHYCNHPHPQQQHDAISCASQPYRLHYHYHHTAPCSHHHTADSEPPPVCVYDSDIDKRQCPDSAHSSHCPSGTVALLPTSKCACQCGGGHSTVAGLSPPPLDPDGNPWCVCPDEMNSAETGVCCTKRASFYRRHLERQQLMATSRSSSTYNRLSKRSRTRSSTSSGRSSYYLPHENDCTAADELMSDPDLLAPSGPASLQLVRSISDVQRRKNSDVTFDSCCGAHYASGVLHWQAMLMPPTASRQVVCKAIEPAPNATDKVDDVLVVASAPPEQVTLDDDHHHAENGNEIGIETNTTSGDDDQT